MAMDQYGSFKGRHFTSEVILWALRWHLAFPISYRDLAVMLSDRSVAVDHTPLFRRVRAYAATLERRILPHLRPCTGSWRFSRLRQRKYLNNIVEQDHRRIKRLVRSGLGFGSLPTAVRTLAV